MTGNLVDDAGFGVSGLLYQANLIMYDRNSDDSLWPQMTGEAACGPREGRALVRRQVVEMTWSGWKELFPGSRVVGIDPAQNFIYRVNPYGVSYENPDNPDFIGFPIPRDDVRRPPKERVLGLPAVGGQSAMAFPFLAMAEAGDAWTAGFDYAGASAVVFLGRGYAGGPGASACRPWPDPDLSGPGRRIRRRRDRIALECDRACNRGVSRGRAAGDHR